jgi:hypothetical protein
MVKYVQHVDGCVSCRVSMYNFYILYVFLVTFCTSSVGCAFGKSISTCLKTTFTCYFIRIGAGARGGHAGAVMPGAVMPGAVMPGAVNLVSCHYIHAPYSPSDHVPVILSLNITAPKPSPLSKHSFRSIKLISRASFATLFHLPSSLILPLMLPILSIAVTLPCLRFLTSVPLLK